jgi:hypothetical protein
MIDKYLVVVEDDNNRTDFTMTIKRRDLEDFVEVMVGNGKPVMVLEGITGEDEKE